MKGLLLIFLSSIGRSLIQPTMASVDLLHCLILTLFLSLFPQAFSLAATPTTSVIVPFQCSATIATCNASLYHINSGIQKEEIAFFYSVDPSQVKPIKYSNREDHLISVPCTCKNISGTAGYFYNTTYKVKLDDTFYDVSNNIYSGQALNVTEEQKNFSIGADFPIHLPCGCVDSDAQIVVTYTVQEKDTLTDIGSLLSAKIENIETMNKKLVENPSFIVLGWVLFVPSEKNGLKNPGNRHKWEILVGILSGVTLLSLSTFILLFIRRRAAAEENIEVPRVVSKTLSANKSFSLHNQLLPCYCERSVQELQVTHKTDVFAYGVVLGELITGQRALFRDHRDPLSYQFLISM